MREFLIISIGGTIGVITSMYVHWRWYEFTIEVIFPTLLLVWFIVGQLKDRRR
jgi:hypothetical protein